MSSLRIAWASDVRRKSASDGSSSKDNRNDVSGATESVSSLFAAVGSVRNACGIHHRRHIPPGRIAGERPEERIKNLLFVPLIGFSEAVRQVDGINQRLGNGNGPVDAPAAFLDSTDNSVIYKG